MLFAHADQLVAEEIKAGTPADRIAIGGFSQGGHVSLNYLPTARVAPAGCIALSTWLVPDPNLQVSLLEHRVQCVGPAAALWVPAEARWCGLAGGRRKQTGAGLCRPWYC